MSSKPEDNTADQLDSNSDTNQKNTSKEENLNDQINNTSNQHPPQAEQLQANVPQHPSNLLHAFECLQTALHISYLPSRLPLLRDLMIQHIFSRTPGLEALSDLRTLDEAVVDAHAHELAFNFWSIYADRLWEGRERHVKKERELRRCLKMFVLAVIEGEAEQEQERRDGEVLVRELTVVTEGERGVGGWKGWKDERDEMPKLEPANEGAGRSAGGWAELKMPALEPANPGVGKRVEYRGKKDKGMEEWKGNDSDEEQDWSDSGESEKGEAMKATHSDTCLVKLRERAEVLDRQELVSGRFDGGEAGSTPGDVEDKGLQEEIQRVYLDLLQRDLAELNLEAPEQ